MQEILERADGKSVSAPLGENGLGITACPNIVGGVWAVTEEFEKIRTERSEEAGKKIFCSPKRASWMEKSEIRISKSETHSDSPPNLWNQESHAKAQRRLQHALSEEFVTILPSRLCAFA